MMKMKKSGIATRSPPKNKQSPLPVKKVRHKISTHNGEILGNNTALEPFEVVHREFQDAIDLNGISIETQEKMFVVAPVLHGRLAVYSKDFFCNVVGLCGEGVALDKVHINEAEILKKWLVKNHHYEIVDCLDSDQATKFSDHWSKVYGENPDNSYFSMRFLRGCFATFVHQISMNWAEEALVRWWQWEENRDRNPKKLGPMALRQQIAALCQLIAKSEALVAKAEQKVKDLTTCPGCQDAVAKLENLTNVDSSRIPNDEPNVDKASPMEGVAIVELESPPNVAADTPPASVQTLTTNVLPANVHSSIEDEFCTCGK